VTELSDLNAWFLVRDVLRAVHEGWLRQHEVMGSRQWAFDATTRGRTWFRGERHDYRPSPEAVGQAEAWLVEHGVFVKIDEQWGPQTPMAFPDPLPDLPPAPERQWGTL
jgi:hypothetical protein